MIRTGVHAVKSLEIVKKQFQDWKIRYSNVVPASELTNKAELEEKLKEVSKMVELKDEELLHLEEYVEGARSLWKRFALSGHLSPTLFNLFVYEYSHVKMTTTPKETW